jgi:thiol:disulfide interchange protein DsbA
MKKLTALSSLVVIAAFIFFTNTTQADFVAGKDYVVLDKAVKTDTGR